MANAFRGQNVKPRGSGSGKALSSCIMSWQMTRAWSHGDNGCQQAGPIYLCYSFPMTQHLPLCRLHYLKVPLPLNMATLAPRLWHLGSTQTVKHRKPLSQIPARAAHLLCNYYVPSNSDHSERGPVGPCSRRPWLWRQPTQMLAGSVPSLCPVG